MAGVIWSIHYYCHEDFPLVWIANHGDMGVDLFFCISGFLIGYILIKECDRYDGKIDIGNFYLNRFWRLWPILFIYDWGAILGEIINDPISGIWKIKDILFLSNFEFGEYSYSPIWSVAIEF